MTPLRPAGDASSLPQGPAQWAGLAFIVGMTGFFMWGLRKETPEEMAAYHRMKAGR